MGYKHKAFKNLSNLIRDGRIPEDVDWFEVFDFWDRWHSDEPRTVGPPVWKRSKAARFYGRAIGANLRAKKYGVEGVLTADDLEEIFLKAGGKCAVCKTDKHLVFDHIVAMYRGGSNFPENIQVLCRICNMEKGVQ